MDLYREVVDRIREKNTEVVVNLTAGMGGDLNVGPDDAPMDWQPGTDLVGGLDRLAHVEAIRPDICSMDCGSLNFGDHKRSTCPPRAMLGSWPSGSVNWACGLNGRYLTPAICGSPRR
ncbi:MAG: hypothetical protein Ct9H300mP12_12510 [Acidimicrobiales bacterium]|nr:MAG: hypothetical protein Ct9H300mP12_12510 [Acidimicrobiales bacterium]